MSESKEEPKQPLPSKPKNKMEKRLKDSSEESYFMICMAGQAGHPMPKAEKKD